MCARARACVCIYRISREETSMYNLKIVGKLLRKVILYIVSYFILFFVQVTSFLVYYIFKISVVYLNVFCNS